MVHGLVYENVSKNCRHLDETKMFLWTALGKKNVIGKINRKNCKDGMYGVKLQLKNFLFKEIRK